MHPGALRLRILLARNDGPASRALVCALVRRGYDVVHVRGGEGLCREIARRSEASGTFEVDLMVSDDRRSRSDWDVGALTHPSRELPILMMTELCEDASTERAISTEALEH